MLNPVQLENSYREFVSDLDQWIPEGVDAVDLSYLNSFGLLNRANECLSSLDLPVTHYFHVIETAEKITLFNDQFVVWIVPQSIDGLSATFTFIALVESESPRLEKAFYTAGVYNSSRIVLRLLERVLDEIHETEEFLGRIRDSG